jgi:ribosomal protein S18 acetylase RimI-like enzyme
MTTVGDTAYRHRIAAPEDTEVVKALDDSFTTGTAFQVIVSEEGFALREILVEPPLTKVFSEDTPDGDGGDDADSRTFVAHGAAGDLAGFVAVSYSGWNHRLTIEDIAVAPQHQGRGVGRALMGLAREFTRERGAGHL